MVSDGTTITRTSSYGSLKKLARRFDSDGLPLDAELFQSVADWFAEVTLVEVEKVKRKSL